MARLTGPFSDTDFALGPGGPTPTPSPVPGPQPTTPMPGTMPSDLQAALAGYGQGQGQETAAGGQASPPFGPQFPFYNVVDDIGEQSPTMLRLKEAMGRVNAALAAPSQYNEAAGKWEQMPNQQNMYNSAMADVNFYRKQVQDEIDHKQDRAEKASDQAEARASASEARALSLQLKQMDQTFQIEQAQASRAFQREERIGGQEFDLERLGLTQEGTRQNTILGSQLAGERESLQRDFDAEQNALNRKLQELQLGIQAGKLNLDTALGVLDKWLQGYQYSLPEGAEYTPGFQPGGAFQQASKLAGVAYNPQNYKANPIPFNPADVVRQTLRGG